MALLIALFAGLMPPDHTAFCKTYREYTSTLTADLTGAYVSIDGRVFIRNLTSDERSRLTRIHQQMNDSRITCN
jgi:hypothetical protein